MTQPDSTTNTGAVEALTRAIINAYHTTRLDPDYVPHILSKQSVRKALATLRATPAPGSEAEVIERCAKVADEHAAQSWGITEEEFAALAIASDIRHLSPPQGAPR